MNTNENALIVAPMNTIVIPQPQESVLDTSAVLTSTSREGQFVHDSQVMGGLRGFKNVSGLWLDKCKTIEQGLNEMATQREQREDINATAGSIEFKADDKGVIIVVDGRDFRPTEHAMKTVCTWFKTPYTIPSFYLNPPVDAKYERDSEDYDLVAYALEVGQRRIAADKELLFRTYKDGTLRAVLSDKYSIIDNEWYLKLIHAIMPDALLSHWRGDADTIYGNVLIPDSIRKETDSEYGGMLSISNCEIGIRKISQLPSIFRAICRNGCIWGQTKGEAYSKRHKGINLEDEAERIRVNIDKQIPLLDSGIDHVLVTRKWKIETRMVQIAAAIGKEYKLPADVMGKVMLEYVNQGKIQSAFGAIDAITRVGQTESPAVWVAMDSLAGQLSYQGSWNRLQAIAKTIKDDEVMKYVAI